MKTKVKKIFNENITFADYGRSGVVYYTDDLDILYALVNQGWKYNIYSNGYRIIPPTVTICDITDCKKIVQYGNTIFNYAYFLFLKQLVKTNKLKNFIDTAILKNSIYYKNFDYHISTGPIIEVELKIEGTDNRVERLKTDMVKEFLATKKYLYNYNYAKKMLKSNNIPLKKEFEYQSLPRSIQGFYNNIEHKNKVIKNGFKLPKYSYEVDLSIFDKIEYDILLFIPNGCYKYINLFVNEKNYRKVMFWEIHIDETKPTTHQSLKKDFKDKKVLIIDSIYSGKTLIYMKNKIKELGGNPILLGICPKNRRVIMLLDYVLILKKIYCTEVIKEKIKISDFFEQEYINQLEGG